MTSALCESLVPIVTQPGIHPSFLSRSLRFAREYVLKELKAMSSPVDLTDESGIVAKVVKGVINTKETDKMQEIIYRNAIAAMKIISGGSLAAAANVNVKTNIRLMHLPLTKCRKSFIAMRLPQ